MVFPLILAAVTGSVSYNEAQHKLMSEKLYMFNQVDLEPLLALDVLDAPEHAGQKLLDVAKVTGATDLLLNCPKGWFLSQGKALAEGTSPYQKALAAQTAYQFSLLTFDGPTFKVNCFEICADTPNVEEGVTTDVQRCFQQTFGSTSWSAACGTYKAECPAANTFYPDSSNSNYARMQYCCPPTCDQCTEVTTGEPIAPVTECTVENQAAKCTADGKTKCVDGHCAAPGTECTVENQAAKCTTKGKTVCVSGHCAARSAAAMSYGAAALLVALMF